jgi:DNA-binding response OmpR family regulator
MEKSEVTTVLLVDDDPDAVRLLEEMLISMRHGYKILRAYGASEALAVMRQTVPDLAIVDLVLTDSSGEELIAHMQDDAALRHVPVVILSAKDASEDRFSLGTPLCLHSAGRLEAARGSKCLQGLLAVVSPHYLV